MRVYFVIFFFILISLDGFSEAEKSVLISSEYSSGPNLIYNCDYKRYICVDEEGYNDCASLKNYSLDSNRLFLICSPVKKYPDIEECKKEQMRFIERVAPTDIICKHPRILDN